MTIPRGPATTLTTHDGKPVDQVMKAFLVECGKVTDYPWSVTQGYNPGNYATSAGTHSYGVVDLPAWDWRRKLEVWCAMGGWGYLRTEDEGDWEDHLHCGINDHPGLAEVAARQQVDFWADPPRSGLKGHAIDRSVLEYRGKFRVFDYREAIEPDPTPVQLARGFMVHSIQDKKKAIRQLRTLPQGRVVARGWRDDMHAQIRDLEALLAKGPKK